MRIRRIVSYYARPASFSTGGVNTSRQQWMAALAGEGLPVLILNVEGGYDQELTTSEGVKFRAIPHTGRGRMSMIPRGLGKIIRDGDLVFLHEGWTPSNLVAAAICKRKGIPYVVMPHGVYEPQLVRDLRFRTIRARAERWMLDGAHAVHIFFDSERDGVASLSSAPCAIAMTGLNTPVECWRAPGSGYLSWLGRYDIHHKGIDTLLSALARIDKAERPRLRMHGPDHRGDRARTEALVQQLGLSGDVEVGGELDREQSVRFLLRSDGFIHVPRWEAFGRTIVESVSLGVPTALSESAHIAASLSQASAAVIVDAECLNLEEALHRLGRDADRLSRNGRTWAADNLDWPKAAERLLSQLGVERTPKRDRA